MTSSWELGEDVQKGLALLANEAAVPEAVFQELAVNAFEVLVRKRSEAPGLTDNPKLAKSDPAVLKPAYAGLAGLLVEAARQGADGDAVRAKAEELGVPAARAQLLGDAFGRRRPELRTVLATTAFDFPHVIGVDWRLDFFVRSNHVDKIARPVYFVKLKTDVGEGKTRDIEFTCSLEELQDLVAKLKDAQKQAERVLAALS